MATLGPLVPADETLNHQITDTFATVAQTDRAWTEKVWAMAAASDGSVQLAFGLGKYANRNVLDGCAGVSRGTEQWTVRASRGLASDPETLCVGPIRYEVLEPFRRVRFALEPNDVSPIAFEWVLDGVVPPFLEEREQHRSRDGARLDADIVRYHQSGTASGWVEVNGRRTKLDSSWVSTRDHSWGVRYGVGTPIGDVAPASVPHGLAALTAWAPLLCQRADGSRYALHVYYQARAFGDWRSVEFQGGEELPTGERRTFGTCVPELRFRDDNRRFLGGLLHLTMPDGTERPLTFAPVSDTGFHLGTGLYFGYEGHFHGEYRGRSHLEADHVTGCDEPQVARRVHQLRDCVVSVDDPVGGGTGLGTFQTVVLGSHPDMGLTEDASFL